MTTKDECQKDNWTYRVELEC